jgi:predicted type IV restriction endonuclease
MTTNWTRDYAYEHLLQNKGLIEGASGSNEATTRVRAINTILFDVLGWDKLGVNFEKYCREVGYADYALIQDGHLCLILSNRSHAGTQFSIN